jgi:phosphoglycerate dehydrogenase-like enzyme
VSTIYVNASLAPKERARLADALAGRDVFWAEPTRSVLHVGPPDEGLLRATIAFGQPDPAHLLEASALRLVQLTSAGWTRYDRDDLRAAMARNGTLMCNASSVFAVPVAEHGVAIMLALMRRLPEALDQQRGSHGWPHEALRLASRRLDGERVLFLGYGAIARAMVPRLLPFGVRMTGYRRRPRGDEEIPVVGDERLAAELAQADHVFDLLPDSATTRGLVDANLLARMKRGARLYNLGRGATVDQDALCAALREGRLDAAWLDVTAEEPLPPEHPLWTTPRLFVSPHTAGGHADEDARQVDLFLSNLAAFAIGRPLADRIF